MTAFYDRAGRPMGLLEWAAAFEEHELRQVAVDRFDGGLVSTVWEGMDPGLGSAVGVAPMIFETIVFRYGAGQGLGIAYHDRYPTEAAAVAGHDRALAWVRAGMPDEGARPARGLDH